MVINNQIVDNKMTSVITHATICNLFNPNGTMNSLVLPYGMTSDLRIFGKHLPDV